MLSRGELLGGLRVQAALATGRSALTAAVLRAFIAALEGGRPSLRPALRELLLGPFAGRPFVHPWQAALVAVAAVHYDVLGGAADATMTAGRLAALYPSVGGSFAGTARDDRELEQALAQRAAQHPPDWEWFLAHGELQTNEPGRALTWILPALDLQAQEPLPLDLLELGASAGALLVGDRLGLHGPVPQVERRLGIDLSPRNIDDPQVRRCLRACVWADQLDRLRRMDAAFLCLQSLRGPGRQGHDDGPQLLAGDMVEQLPVAMQRLHQCPPGPRRLLIYNAVSTSYLDDDAYARLQGRVQSALLSWSRVHGNHALWIEMEPPRGKFENLMELRAFRLHGTALEPILLGHLPPHPYSRADLSCHQRGWARLLDGRRSA